MNRGRIHAQGDDTDKSEAWTTPYDVTKSFGIDKVDELTKQLTPKEFNKRQKALQQAKLRINSTPDCGISALYKKSYWDDYKNRAIRVDIDVLKGIAFIDNPKKN